MKSGGAGISNVPISGGKDISSILSGDLGTLGESIRIRGNYLCYYSGIGK